MNLEKTKDFLRLNLFFIVVGLACVVYVIRGLVNIVETGKTVAEIIADGALSALFGFFISKLLSLQGLAKGELDERVLKTNRLHSQKVEEISEKICYLDEWCERKNQEALKNVQTKILANAGIAYSEFLEGRYKIINKEGYELVLECELPKYKRRAVKKARRIKLTPLSSSVLTSDGGKREDPYNFGQDKKSYSRRRDEKQLLSKVICGLLFGYYGVTMITDFSWSDLIWTAIQVTIFLVMGMISYLQSFFFVVDEYRHRVIKKIDNLEKFQNECRVVIE